MLFLSTWEFSVDSKELRRALGGRMEYVEGRMTYRKLEEWERVEKMSSEANGMKLTSI